MGKVDDAGAAGRRGIEQGQNELERARRRQRQPVAWPRAARKCSIEKLLSACRSTVQEFIAPGSPGRSEAGLPLLSAVNRVQMRAGGVCPVMR